MVHCEAVRSAILATDWLLVKKTAHNKGMPVQVIMQIGNRNKKYASNFLATSATDKNKLFN